MGASLSLSFARNTSRRLPQSSRFSKAGHHERWRNRSFPHTQSQSCRHSMFIRHSAEHRGHVRSRSCPDDSTVTTARDTCTSLPLAVTKGVRFLKKNERKMGEKWGQTEKNGDRRDEPHFFRPIWECRSPHTSCIIFQQNGVSPVCPHFSSPFFIHFSLAAPVFVLFEGWALGTTVAEGFSEPGGSKAQDVGGIVPTLRTSRRMGQPKF
jgi:hypothetical protein